MGKRVLIIQLSVVAFLTLLQVISVSTGIGAQIALYNKFVSEVSNEVDILTTSNDFKRAPF